MLLLNTDSNSSSNIDNDTTSSSNCSSHNISSRSGTSAAVGSNRCRVTLHSPLARLAYKALLMMLFFSRYHGLGPLAFCGSLSQQNFEQSGNYRIAEPAECIFECFGTEVHVDDARCSPCPLDTRSFKRSLAFAGSRHDMSST